MEILTVTQPGRGTVFGDVTLKQFELLWAADQMVEALRLPEFAGLFQFAIDLRRRELFPRVALLFHVGLAE